MEKKWNDETRTAMTALLPPLSPMHKQIEGTKNRYNQIYHKKRKYKNNWISAWYKKSDKTNRGETTGCMKTKTSPVQKYKSSIDIYQNHRTSQKIYSALVRSSTGFWGETSSLFCCLSELWWWELPGRKERLPPCEPPLLVLDVCRHWFSHDP